MRLGGSRYTILNKGIATILNMFAQGTQLRKGKEKVPYYSILISIGMFQASTLSKHVQYVLNVLP